MLHLLNLAPLLTRSPDDRTDTLLCPAREYYPYISGGGSAIGRARVSKGLNPYTTIPDSSLIKAVEKRADTKGMDVVCNMNLCNIGDWNVRVFVWGGCRRMCWQWRTRRGSKRDKEIRGNRGFGIWEIMFYIVFELGRQRRIGG